MLNGFFDININNFGFGDSLIVMLQGLLSIFAITAVLILCVYLLNKTGKKKDK